MILRRAATRLTASTLVMVALNGLSRTPTTETPTATAETFKQASANGPAPTARPFAEAITASGRMDRIRRSARPAPVASRAGGDGFVVPEGVLLFDRCVPACDSRDPRLPSRVIAAAMSDPRSAQDGPAEPPSSGEAGADDPTGNGEERPGPVRMAARAAASVASEGLRRIGSGLGAALSR